MIIRQFKDTDISLYGMGCMRLPKTDAADDKSIDEAAAFAMVDYAYGNGVNYFDTAYGYHGGMSEVVMGKALSRYERDTFTLATKFPGYDANNWGKHEEIFKTQLERLQTSYVDMYLIHNVCESNIDAYLDSSKYGDVEYFINLRNQGEKIRHLGFSVHGSLEVMQRFLDKYGQDMEFVQIQLNFIDYKFQDAKAKLELARKYNLPVIVMEPLRGGSLVKASDAEAAKLDAARPGTNIIEWSLRYLQGFDEVFTILNGASTMEQLKENIGYFCDEAPLSADELKVLQEIADGRLDCGIAPCTACHYCVEHCPVGLDIPYLLDLFNEHKFTGGGWRAPMLLGAMDQNKLPKCCVACGACAQVCPQSIDIPQMLAEFSKMLDGKF